MKSPGTNSGLERFLEAQESVYEEVVRELRSGEKRSHWMWFIFPQIAGLGSSAMAREFAISGREEAIRYLDHPLLGGRLRECSRLVLAVSGRSIEQIFGYPDHLKFCSSMTLFAQVTPENEDFTAPLAKYFGGRPDGATLQRLGQGSA